MRRLFLLVVLMLPLLGVAGCEEGPTEATVSTTGTWVGTAQVAGNAVTVNLVLAESARNITGSGTVTSAAGSASGTVSGRNNYPNVTLSFQQMSYQGTFAGNNMIAGTLSGPGFSNVELDLQRQ